MSGDTPGNTGKTPDQKPQRLNEKLRRCRLGALPRGHFMHGLDTMFPCLAGLAVYTLELLRSSAACPD